jgi:zinc transport system substrate-binding protein
VQKEFDSRNAEIIAREAGVKIVSINPLSYKWSEEMIAVAKALSE